MAEYQTFTITHYMTDGKVDFNTLSVPFELMQSLIGHLKTDFNTRLSALAAPSFREERAMQHQRHLEHAIKNNITPKQQFIDFPLS
jgi:hypothetical protein